MQRYTFYLHTIIITVLFCCLLAALQADHPPPVQAATTIVYVDATAAGGDGGSWATAYADLQAALAAADPAPGATVEIWVARGTYKPTNTGDRVATFQLKNNVALYGGFAGTETDRSQRNPTANPTILSGDLLGNDNNNIASDEPSRADNSYHVVYSNGTDATAVLDSFTISGGQAYGCPMSNRHLGGGMYNVNSNPTLSNITFSHNIASKGGGMYNDHSNPALINVTFSQNTAFKGGGMYNVNNSSPRLTDVTFNQNSASDVGGMYNVNSNPTLINVTFSHNSASSCCGGMHNDHSNPTLINVIFSHNSAFYWGGGMYNYNNSSPTLTNVTFSGNSLKYYGGGGMENNFDCNPVITNSIFWGNHSRSGTGANAQIDNNGSTPTVTYSLVQGGYPGAGNLDLDPLFMDANDNLRLQETSPAIDAGNNAAIPADITDLDGDGNTTELVPHDLAHNPRFIDHPRTDTGSGTPPIVDMGAYEATIGDLILNPAKVSVAEGGATAIYQVALTRQPASNVTIIITTDGQTTIDPPTLTFTGINWNTSQPVTVTAVDNDLAEGSHSSTISHSASSNDPAYDGLNFAPVMATIADNDMVMTYLPLITK